MNFETLKKVFQVLIKTDDFIQYHNSYDYFILKTLEAIRRNDKNEIEFLKELLNGLSETCEKMQNEGLKRENLLSDFFLALTQMLEYATNKELKDSWYDAFMEKIGE